MSDHDTQPSIAMFFDFMHRLQDDQDDHDDQDDQDDQDDHGEKRGRHLRRHFKTNLKSQEEIDKFRLERFKDLGVPVEKDEKRFPPGNLGYTAAKYGSAEEYPEFECEGHPELEYEKASKHLKYKSFSNQDVHVVTITCNIIYMITQGREMNTKEKRASLKPKPPTISAGKELTYVKMKLFQCLTTLAKDQSSIARFSAAFGKGGTREEREFFWEGYDKYIDGLNKSDHDGKKNWAQLIQQIMQELAKSSPAPEQVQESLGSVVNAFAGRYGMVC